VVESAELKRSVVKAITYRLLIVCLDFLAVFLFTRRIEIAVGFMIASNVYTTIAYVAHERVWSRVGWGREAKHTHDVRK
jgi:uncharacterized membrane protein